MIERFYKATTGYHDLTPGQTSFGFMVKVLNKKRAMLPYIAQLDDNTRDELESSKSSHEFASKFVDWRNTLSKRITHQFIENYHA